MTKNELIERIFKIKTLPNGITKKTITLIVDEVFEYAKKSVKKNGRFAYPHFGTLVKKKRKGRKGINPKTRAPIKIQSRRAVVFRPALEFKETINKGGKQE